MGFIFDYLFFGWYFKRRQEKADIEIKLQERITLISRISDIEKEKNNAISKANSYKEQMQKREEEFREKEKEFNNKKALNLTNYEDERDKRIKLEEKLTALREESGKITKEYLAFKNQTTEKISALETKLQEKTSLALESDKKRLGIENEISELKNKLSDKEFDIEQYKQKERDLQFKLDEAVKDTRYNELHEVLYLMQGDRIENSKEQRFFINTDTGKISYANKAVKDMYGEDIIGKNYTEILPEESLKSLKHFVDNKYLEPPDKYDIIEKKEIKEGEETKKVFVQTTKKVEMHVTEGDYTRGIDIRILKTRRDPKFEEEYKISIPKRFKKKFYENKLEPMLIEFIAAPKDISEMTIDFSNTVYNENDIYVYEKFGTVAKGLFKSFKLTTQHVLREGPVEVGMLKAFKIIGLKKEEFIKELIDNGVPAKYIIPYKPENEKQPN